SHPQHTSFTAPSTSQPSNIHTTPVTKEAASMPHELPLQSVHSLGRDAGSLSLHELTKEAVAEVDTAHVINWNDPSVIRYHALQNIPRSIAEVRKNMLMYLKNRGGYKMKDFKGMSYDDIRPIFEKVWDQVHSFVTMDSEEEGQRLKRAGQDVEAKPAKRQRTKKKFNTPKFHRSETNSLGVKS
ncbi:hypothetical protein Tco_0125856, partial [Tanacetum coccineum]